jgi:PPM family protein phosphatase
MAQPSERCHTPSQLFPHVSTQEPLGDGEINHRVLQEEVGVQAAANALLQPALEAGGDDNVSVIVVGSGSG